MTSIYRIVPFDQFSPYYKVEKYSPPRLFSFWRTEYWTPLTEMWGTAYPMKQRKFRFGLFFPVPYKLTYEEAEQAIEALEERETPFADPVTEEIDV